MGGFGFGWFRVWGLGWGEGGGEEGSRGLVRLWGLDLDAHWERLRT